MLSVGLVKARLVCRPGKGMAAAMALLLSCPSPGSVRHARCPGRGLTGVLSYVFVCLYLLLDALFGEHVDNYGQ